MNYSTIQPKQGICQDCPPGTGIRRLIGKRCQYHYNQHLRLKSAKKASERTKDSAKRYAENRASNALMNASLSEWFDQRRKEMTGICMETGKPTQKHSDVYFRFCLAHILPKSLFPSVATHRWNCLELSVEAHTKFDRNWGTAAKMKVFAEAKRRFILFANDIATEERKRIPEAFFE